MNTKRLVAGIVAATTPVVLTFTGPAAATTNSDTCYDKSPGVVTKWEFNHIKMDRTRRQVTCSLGVQGHKDAPGWWEKRYHIEIMYPTAKGGYATVQYVDKCSCGGRWYSVRKVWYGPQS